MRKLVHHIIVLTLLCGSTVGAFAQQRGGSMGVPFFKNYAAQEYRGHNRNFDVLCDSMGHVFFANFEGLLAFNHVEWQVIHTPGISRITDLSRGKDGKIWFSGANVKGYVESLKGDSVSLHFTESDKNSKHAPARRLQAEVGKVDRWHDVEVYQRLRISSERTLLATATEGVVAIDAEENEVWRLNAENGLCSNSVTQIAYDGKGTVWGATDNGVFRISVSEIYTHFGENEGLRGQVASLAKSEGVLMVGTFQGLFRQEGQKFHQVSGINHACWQMEKGKDERLYVATSDGVYTYFRGNVQQNTQQFALSIMAMDDGHFLVGELEKVCRYGMDGKCTVLDNIPNMVRFKKDAKGGVWGLTLAGEYYYLPAGKDHFERMKEGPISQLFEYVDDKGYRWKSNDNGFGLVCEGMPEEVKKWVLPFATYNVQTMLLEDGIAWIGSNNELIRFDIGTCLTARLHEPQVYIRTFHLDGKDFAISFSNNKIDPMGKTLYSYRLYENGEWSKWAEQHTLHFPNMGYGNYKVSVRSKDAFGQVSQSEPISVEVPLPIYLRWYAIMLYIVVIAYGIYLLYRYRLRRLEAEQQRLEAIVEERTKEVVKQKDEIASQKDEIEEKSHKLEDALGELRSAQNQLLRQEREATIGKLTKGLIDRILNPMNYINNFSHLTLGLTKDLKENLEDEKENISEDVYEDSVDVIEMMHTNLEKIEQHGLSTTRILKAMEELLKERSRKIETLDIGLLCQQSIDLLKNYYANDIARYGIQVEWTKPELPIVADVIAEELGKAIMSMLANSVYAIGRKLEKGKQPGYVPQIKLSIVPCSGTESPDIHVYDNGVGIEEGILDKIFDPFFTTKPTAEAPGVGLYLSQQAIHDFGGSISVKSQKDEYTEFIISLP